MSFKNIFNKLLFILVIFSSNVFSMHRIRQVVNQITASDVDSSNKISIHNILNNPDDKEFIVQEVTNNFLKYSRPKTYQELPKIFSELFIQIKPGKDVIDNTKINQWLNENFIIEAMLCKYPELASKFSSLAIDNFDKIDPLVINFLLMNGENSTYFAKPAALTKNSFLTTFSISIDVLKTTNEYLIPLFEILINKLVEALNNNTIKNEQDFVILLDDLLKQENTKEYLKKHPFFELALNDLKPFEKLKELIYEKMYNGEGLGGEGFQKLLEPLSVNINAISEIFKNFKKIFNICLEKNQNFEKALIQLAIEHPKDISKENLELIDVLATREEDQQAKLVSSVNRYIPGGMDGQSKKEYEDLLMDEQSKQGYEDLLEELKRHRELIQKYSESIQDLRDQLVDKIKKDYEQNLIKQAKVSKKMSDAMCIASCL